LRAFVNGIAIDFDLVGHGPTLVLIHALGTDRRMWAQQVPVFAEGHQILAYDVRGHGHSDKPAGPYSLESLADDLRGLLDALGIGRASLLGLSIGGMIAQTFALRYPDVVGRLILADTTSEYPPEGRRQFAERALQVEANGIGPIVPATLERWFTSEFRVEDGEAVEEIRKILAAADPVGYAGACLAVSQVDTTARLGQIRVPTLVLVGEHDPGTPVEAAARIQRAIPGARLEVIPGASHLSNIARPGLFADLVLGFLAEGMAPAEALEGDEPWRHLPEGSVDVEAVAEEAPDDEGKPTE
jgi:3-oxoadipate enol-lactonase